MQSRHRKSPPPKARVTTRDLLSAAPAKERINPKWRRHHEHLKELLEYVTNNQTNLARDAREELPGFSTHMADAGTDTYDRDFALGMLSSEQDAAYEIVEALNRIRDGTYGICELTGKPIPAQRLAAIPWTRFTVEAEKPIPTAKPKRAETVTSN
jgi:RNA polymerase-binding transcription factor DksA